MSTTLTVGNNNVERRSSSSPTEVTGRRVEFDYLRTFVILLVVWHHAILAYTAAAYKGIANIRP